MDNSNKSIENLIEKADTYAKTTLKLYKYETLSKSAEIASDLAVRFIVVFVIIIFLLFMSVGFSVWIGEQLCNNFYGFFIVALVYLCLAFLIYIFREKWVKNPVSNFIIKKLKNEIEL